MDDISATRQKAQHVNICVALLVLYCVRTACSCVCVLDDLAATY